jgi:hypothetical protein
MNRRLTFTLTVVLIFASHADCAAQDPTPGFSLKLTESRRIWDAEPFNGFTDLIRFHVHWYLALREATDHAGTWDGKIRVLRSKDGQQWESSASISCPKGSQVDLRDPKLSITPHGQLMLTSTAYWPRETLQSYTWFSEDGVSWSPATPVGPPGEWLWRTEWHEGIAYNFGANRLGNNSLQLYTSANGRKFEPYGPRHLPHGDVNETGIVFAPDDTFYVLLRKSPHAMLGIAKPPYKDFVWKDLGKRIGGPEMILLPNGELLAAGRLYDDGEYTALLSVDPGSGTLTKLLRLPSGGDTSYPGLVLDGDDLLWVSYYSSHEGKTSVYLAQVEVNYQTRAQPPISAGD